MRVRHRIPSIFNLSMVDVLCCALGCVILLSLLNRRFAQQYEADSLRKLDERESLLAQATADRDALRSQLATLEEDRARVREQARAQALTVDDLRGKLRASGARADELDEKLRAALARVTTLDATARDSARRGDDLAARLKRADDRVKELQAAADLVPSLREELTTARARSASQEAAAKGLQTDLAKRGEELAAARAYRERWEESEARARALEKQLGERERLAADASKQLEMLEGQKKVLQAEAVRYRLAADNRFAGIALTGKRVVFLVDMSGSMDLVDEDTPAPNKWPEVRQTLVKIMRSLPDLEKFQVIVFAERAAYLLGGEGRWLDYDARTSPDQARDALAAVRPKGGTNMYAALEAAFRMRAQGLDTLYLLSDGLPNIGEGLRPEDAARLKEVERSDILARYIRRKLKADWNRPEPDRPRVRINSIGFFYESPDVGAFLWALSRENDGSFVGMSKP
jgi:hypothetical protein